MIQANELRIGNLVSFYGKFEKVESIGTCGVSFKNGFAKYTLPNLKPIPLTEEILLKFGFTVYDDKYKYFAHKEVPGILQLFDGVAEYSIDSNEVCWVNGLHQLQNLYHALTGQELKIEL